MLDFQTSPHDTRETNAAAGSLFGKRILIAEDEYLIAEELERALEGQGATVVGPAPKLAFAIDLIELWDDLDGAVLGVRLGREKSYPLLDTLLERGVSVVLLTGYNADLIPEKYRKLPLYQKPADPGRIAKKLCERLCASGTVG